jgi:cellulose biosynthesis protein BcsQ
MKVIVIANVAGGVGKTTAAHAIAVAAVEYGKKVLLVDADPAAALTFCCGIENPRITSFELLTEQFSLASSIIKSSERFSFVPSSSRLASIDPASVIDKKKFLKQCEDFEVVIADTSSSLNPLLTYFLELADLVISDPCISVTLRYQEVIPARFTFYYMIFMPVLRTSLLKK